MGDGILESESLIRGHRVCRNSAGNPEISVSLADRIAETLIYGNRRKSGDDLEIERNNDIDKRFHKTMKTAERKQYKESNSGN